ncbi:TIR domain-containing protein [Flagellimonas zhangzhouensis]|uniref:MTH538 TIR-like domain n=1 Tax=Flagellimonas zhangzhouensis TaxID=1073328 RepID=A0A1H2WQ79_9FLAO|nr:TIR domain-containing protein [Allomuricauda zhangzhouensis]SDQ23651.1 MTH538 TIR-like domain [Allomuricauda zhangzhouensis]SDW82810.1 MTH538 TIR-like domain [Allomuricauda zhangzhouensis]
MGRKVFISYKYADTQVESLGSQDLKFDGSKFYYQNRTTRVRDYVDELQKLIGKDNINLGEKDGESLAEFTDETIRTSLKEKIFGSSITIVMISKGMKDIFKLEKDQWIPWEISYSLKEITRSDRTSRMNAVLGIVLPDITGTYTWFLEKNPTCNSLTHKTDQLFDIIKKNMFNQKLPETSNCNGNTIFYGESSYIKMVRWDEFISNHSTYIQTSIDIRDNQDNYKITKTI